MSNLLQQIKSDQLQARKDKDVVKSSVLTTLIGEAVMVGKNDGNRDTIDSEVVAVVKKFIKNIDETLKVAKDSAQFLSEREILVQYLPSQLSEEELTNVVSGIVATLGVSGPKEMGKVMKALKDQYDGQYDGSLASKVVKHVLA